MALKVTKVMAARLTEKLSLNSDPPFTTGKASAVSANTSPSSHKLGLEAEAIVEKHYLELGFRLLKRRWKTGYAEVDLLFRYPDCKSGRHVLLVEVKKRSTLAFREWAVSARQKMRIRRAAQSLMEKGFEVECKLAFVDENSNLEIFSEVFC